MGAAAGVLPPGGMGMRVLGMIAAAGWPCKYEPSESALIIIHTRVQWNMHVGVGCSVSSGRWVRSYFLPVLSVR